MIRQNHKPLHEEEVLVLEETEKKFQLILYNDDVNTFDFVIETLVDYCGHDPIQAEQCAYLVHYTGKCSVKEGSFEKLEPICTELLRKGLSATIE
ncbi:MAG: ATP-dependent Clp protease adaptor ClpS [Bacteroidia bacterium]|nr:ATP-dependent Clp protease adaptor ClpS [Bacteroidia bacterium]